MFTIENTLYVDISNLKYARAKTKQYDNKFRYITVILNDDGKPLDLVDNTVKVYIQKSDGTKVLNDVKYIDINNGVVQIELTSQMTTVEGIMPCELVIWDSKKKAVTTSYPFEIEIEKTYYKQSDVVSENEFNILGTIVRFEEFSVLAHEWQERTDGLFEVLINHNKNVSSVFAKGIGEDNEDRFLAVEIVDTMSAKVITDEQENMKIIIDHRF